jgi:hypothetical protein
VRKLFVIALILSLAACAKKNIQTKEAAREAVVEHLGKVAGLDGSKMDVEITQMSFQESTAEVGVSIVPKGMSANEGMQMGYQLKREGDKWVVAGKRGGGAGHGGAPGAGGVGSAGGAEPK